MSISISEGGPHPNLKLLSNSSLSLLNGCPRKYELYKLLPKKTLAVLGDAGEEGSGNNIDTAFGSIVGYGIQLVLLEDQAIEQIYYQMFLAWKVNLEEAGSDWEEKKKKSFWYAMVAIEKFYYWKQEELRDWEVASFPHLALELGFSIDCGDGWKYRGKLDALLRHKRTGKYAVLECKTTGSSNVHEAMYKNQAQGIGYSIVVDTIAKLQGVLTEEPYDVYYPVYKTKAMEWEMAGPFRKTHTQRALWIKDILLAIKQISDYSEEGYFPLRGDYCYSYYRPCKYFDVCSFSNSFFFPQGLEKNVELLEDDEEEYFFKFSLEEIIDAQLAKQVAGSGEVK